MFQWWRSQWCLTHLRQIPFRENSFCFLFCFFNLVLEKPEQKFSSFPTERSKLKERQWKKPTAGKDFRARPLHRRRPTEWTEVPLDKRQWRRRDEAVWLALPLEEWWGQKVTNGGGLRSCPAFCPWNWFLSVMELGLQRQDTGSLTHFHCFALIWTTIKR